MRYLGKWQRMLAGSRGKTSALVLAARIRARYDSLVSSHAHVRARPLRAQLRDLVLPGLALYLTLREDADLSQEEALAACERLFLAAFFPVERKLIPLLNALPDPFPVLRPALRRMTRETYAPGSTKVVEDSPDCFAVDTYRCFILDTLTAAGAPELAPLFCKTDDWLAELLPKVRFVRAGTLAGGAVCCDFRWCRGGEG
jgi:hypothetical protein